MAPAESITDPSESQRALPAPNDGATKVQVDGSAVSLYDELGPLVLNSDKTLSRITGWKEMTALERERTLRILGKRNQLRFADARQAEEASRQ